ncbi:polygalacturonase At1g48100 isoform X2 [Physcomitrium patens]|uniref:polygalacturonase At1g48100 isoform X2 n=1 Tax=Physcomitrium patens TaxID=3218 RepID=UPI000D173FEC|nr:polygalacturonase At1g48100-like isoform X2 [Physcomitrium patens]|eukprot:XP_024402435.1 polygalacturonase At1g48100-like isoform X2 [Physcomitrella patens]
MTYRRRVLCLLYVLAVVPSCVRVRSWQETEEITMSRLGKRSSGFAFTSSEAHKAPHAKKPHEKKVPHHKRDAGWVEGAPGPSSHEGKACMGEGCTYDVMAFNAVGDGITDDTKATWRAACQSESSVMVVPAYYVFVVGQITFKGPCKHNLTFQIEGVIIPPTDLAVWNKLSNKVQWIGFYKQVGMMLRGSGAINGLGEVWWSQPCKAADHGRQRCASPTALKFYGCINVSVRDITIQDSPQMHLKFDNCQQVEVFNVSILSPGWSPNTDGIHLQNTGYALLQNLVIAAGDDCISLQTGTTDVTIRDVVCGPGHGISIGGLGQGGSQACVSNITVQDVLIKDTQNGVRIKTWQGGSGVVQHVTFDTVTVVNVQNPIVINQFYCDAKECQNDTAAVLISDIAYSNIRGTYDQARCHAPVYFACSDTVPCRNIKVDNVELLPAQANFFTSRPFCWNSYGASDPLCYPPLCLIDDPFVEESDDYFC